MDPVYGYQAVNVEAQSRSLSSLLSWTKRMIAVRKSSQVFGRGSLSFIRPANRAVLVYVREYKNEVILCVANLSRSAQSAEIDLSPWRGRVPLEMAGRSRFGPIGDSPFIVTLAPYGFFWFLLCEAEGPVEQPIILHEPTTLVFTEGLKSLFERRTRLDFERDVLPPFLRSRRWFAHKNLPSFQAKLERLLPITGDPSAMLAIVEIDAGESRARYSLPLKVSWTRLDRRAAPAANALAPVRRGPREGMLIDACADQDVVTSLIARIHAAANEAVDGAEVEFRPTRLFAQSPLPQITAVKAVEGEQSNSTVIADSACVLKLYRRLRPGTNPEVDMGRFLTDVAGYQNAPALLGTVEMKIGEERTTLAILHAFLQNQGDGWAQASAYLDRFLDEQRLITGGAAPEESPHASFLQRMRQMGKRIGELHLALASRPDDADFAPEPIGRSDLTTWRDELAGNIDHMFDELARRRADIRENAQPLADALLERRQAAFEHARSLLPDEMVGQKIRHHGDLHLGQVLNVKDDVYILDFEGEPGRSNEERRRKAPPARDVAGMIRSLDYAAVAALDRAVKTGPEEQARLQRALEPWRAEASEALLASYRETLGGSPLWPADPALAAKLLHFFVLEKAIYEIGYELANRPSWLHVPLAGAWRVLFAAEAPA
jgi:maltose alpha-D-glucosyltransferase/alpha-amylase